MRGYTTNPAIIQQQVLAYKGTDVVLFIDLEGLQVRMPSGDIVPLDATPHYQYTLGNKQPYCDWLIEHSHLYESSLASFEDLMNDGSLYLEGSHAQDFILCDRNFVIIDGVHRATRLFQLGVVRVPVLWRTSHE